MNTHPSHHIDAFRAWLLDRPLDDIPAVLIPAWMEVHDQIVPIGEWQCERLVRYWRRWVGEQVALAEVEEQDV